MKVLVIGSGGREHAICDQVSKSKSVDMIFAAPGNGGMCKVAKCIDIKADNIDGLLTFAKNNSIDLTIVGPETPLVLGIVDLFNKNNLKIFGPTKELANLEGSKLFAKEMMRKFNIPTASFEVFDKAEAAKNYLKTSKFPLVVKADGLCAGKGVVIAKNYAEAEAAINDMMVKKIFGSNSDKVIIEEMLVGEEASILVLCDGKNYIMLDSSQDHKRIFDNDLGPNTGGMGAYSPAPIIDRNLFKEIENSVVKPMMEGLSKENKFYKGILYAGIMVTTSGPKVLEFNVRLGDPETQAVLPRLKSDFVEAILNSIDGKLENKALIWDKRPSVTVVLASGGYPGQYETGKAIEGLEEALKLKDVMVFHAGTKLDKTGSAVTNGGRVLNVTAFGDTLAQAIKNCYKACGLIRFENMHYRTDIGKKGLKLAHS